MFNLPILYAQFDIPCGIYETDTMMHAVETVRAMTQKITELKNDNHTLARMTHVKEEYAQVCKRELLILWTDYFKPEHLVKYPDLHDKVWKAAKLCSKVKREVNLSAVDELEKAVKEIAKIFAQSKK